MIADAGDRERLRGGGGLVVWLRAKIETLVDRLGNDTDRPWLRPDPETALRRLYAGRDRHYAEVADLTVDVDHQPPSTVVDRILAALPATDRR